MTVQELCAKFEELEKLYDEQKAQLDATKEEWDSVELQLLEAMVEEGTKSIDIEGLGRFTMATRNYLSVNAANKETFYPYLKESGNGALLKEEVNPKTLTAFLDGHLEDLIAAYVAKGLDGVTARQEALTFLNSKGASYFSKKQIRRKK